jgi:hypothetical protein
MVVAFPTSAGTFVLAPRVVSGQQRDLYGTIDIFDTFEANRNGGLFDQPDEASGVMAYVTPKFAGEKVVFKVATLNLGTSNDDNEEDIDASAYRFMYQDGNLTAGFGQVFVSDKVVPTADYHRTQLTAQYKFGEGHQLGLTHEMIEDHPAGGGSDFDTTGLIGRFSINSDYDAGIGIFTQSGDQENDGMVLNLRKKMGEQSYLYAELADFDNGDLGYVSFGANVGFRGVP